MSHPEPDGNGAGGERSGAFRSRRDSPRRPTHWPVLPIVAGLAVFPAVVTAVDALDLTLNRAGRLVLTVLTIGSAVGTLALGVDGAIRTYGTSWSRRRRRTTAAAAAGAFAVILAVVVTLQDPFPTLERLPGTQDVASVGFVRPDGSTTPALADLSQGLVDRLSATLAEHLPESDSQVVSYAPVPAEQLRGLVEGGSPELERWTAELVSRTEAELLLAGVVDDSDRQLRIRPAIYVHPELVPEVPELMGWIVGPWTIGVGGLESRRGRESLLEAFLADGTAVARFVDALDAWRVGDVAETEALLAAVLQEREAELFSADLLRLFHGHALQRLALVAASAAAGAGADGPEPGDAGSNGVTTASSRELLQRAAEQYAAIGGDSPIALRARLSLATNTYLQSVGRLCAPDSVDAARLDQARSDLRAFTREDRLPPASRAAALVNYVQAERCAGRAGMASDEDGVREALAGIRSIPVTDELTGQAVERVQALGLSIEAEIAQEAGATGRAVALLREAAALTDDPADRGRWWGFISIWEAGRCNLGGARAAFDEAREQYEAAAGAGRISPEFVSRYTAAAQRELAEQDERCQTT
jgi:hypothetical protein